MSINIQNSIRQVSYVNGEKCVNCYYEDEFPCNLCILKNNNTHNIITIMDWDEFITNVSHTFLKNKLTKVPKNYDEYCELYEDYHDLPALIYPDSDNTISDNTISDNTISEFDNKKY